MHRQSRTFLLPNLDPRDLAVTFDFAQDDTMLVSGLALPGSPHFVKLEHFIGSRFYSFVMTRRFHGYPGLSFATNRVFYFCVTKIKNTAVQSGSGRGVRKNQNKPMIPHDITIKRHPAAQRAGVYIISWESLTHIFGKKICINAN